MPICQYWPRPKYTVCSYQLNARTAYNEGGRSALYWKTFHTSRAQGWRVMTPVRQPVLNTDQNKHTQTCEKRRWEEREEEEQWERRGRRKKEKASELEGVKVGLGKGVYNHPLPEQQRRRVQHSSKCNRFQHAREVRNVVVTLLLWILSLLP